MAQKKAAASKKKTQKKATTRKASTEKGGSAAPKKTAPAASVSLNPLAVLVIMVLATVIIVMATQVYRKTSSPDRPKTGASLVQKESASKTTSVPEKDAEDPVSKSEEALVKKGDQVDKKDARDTSGKSVAKKESDKAKDNRETAAVPEKSVKVYFIRFNEKTEATSLYPVTRTVRSSAMLKETLQQLIQGPTPGEKKKGLLSAVPGDLKIRGVRMKGRSAEIDFSNAIELGASGSILLNRIDQIVYTATQFDGVESVVITVDGRKRSTLGSDGLSIGGPLHRRK